MKVRLKVLGLTFFYWPLLGSGGAEAVAGPQ